MTIVRPIFDQSAAKFLTRADQDNLWDAIRLCITDAAESHCIDGMSMSGGWGMNVSTICLRRHPFPLPCDRTRHLFVVLLGVGLRGLGHVAHFSSQLAPAAVIGAGGEDAAGGTCPWPVLRGVTDLVRHLVRLLAEPAVAAGRQRVRGACRLGGAAEDARHLVGDGAGEAARLLTQLAVALAVGAGHHRVVAARGRRALERLRHLVRRRVEDLGRGRAEVAVALLVGAGRQGVGDGGAVVGGGARVAGAETHGAGVVGLEPLLDGVDD
ncbi:hypothetical protein PG991_015029 [Apiospora marii]|uniref:Uncharacterized protein n=1 Tax=Apiospora marii TaxID=335849 RepID=A0ABR1R2V7_9PEZI